MKIENTKKILWVVAPLIFISVFLYMTYYNASYDHPGKEVYTNQCAGCHGDNGEGIKSLVPPIFHADMAENNVDSLPCWILKGMNHPIAVNGKAYDQPMYPIGLDEVQISNLLNYLKIEMVSSKVEINSAWVTERMKKCK